jgi:hypothetical protein
MTNKYFISLQKGVLALMSAALLFSCSQIEPFEMEGDDKVLLSSGINSAIGGGNCLVDCITDVKSTWKVKTYTQHYDDDEGTLTIKVYNSPDSIFYEITSTADIRQVTFGGVSKYASSTAAVQPFIIKEKIGEFGVGKDWKACDEKAVAINVKRNNVTAEGGGVSQTVNTTYNLIGVCQGCDDEFSAVTTCNGNERSATFTFTAGDDAFYKIQGGLTASISNVEVDGAAVINVTGNGNNIISWSGALEECDERTITITWNSSNTDDEITGDWSVEKDGVKILVIDALECDDEAEGYAPEVI